MTRSRGARKSRLPYLIGTALGLLAVFLFSALLTFDGHGGMPAGPLAYRFADAAGLLGRFGAKLCLDAFGWGGGWIFPVLLLVWSWNRLRRHRWTVAIVPSILSIALAVASASLLATFWHGGGGGAVGLWVAGGARALLGPVGSFLFLTAVAILAVGFVAEREALAFLRFLVEATRLTGAGLSRLGRAIASGAQRSLASAQAALARSATGPTPVLAGAPDRSIDAAPKKARKRAEPAVAGPPAEPRIVTNPAMQDRRPEQAPREGVQMPIPSLKPPREPMAEVEFASEPEEDPVHLEEGEPIELPGTDLLDMPANLAPPVSQAELLESSRVLVQTLADFGVVGKVGEVHPGPVITRYEFEPAAGVRISQIQNRADDLALALRAMRIRIVAPIPGKAAVGVEIPNRHPATVYLKEIVGRPEFDSLKGGLAIALGRDIGGKPYYADLTKMPHLLIAGTTGSGKSVCVNSIITSLILRKTPRELRLLMIDPKMLELPVYNGIPHLLMPVVTDPKLAARTLRGLITEMERRYGILARRGVRNIDAYHERLDEDVKDGLEVIGERLPYVVAIIDELADLMITTAAEVEEPIGRLAQTARAVGIHLIVATQRPSVDVITGVIKANFPSRIAFQVASRTDSRTILDMNGAESLLGKGDMLFMPSGRPEADRVHGAFVSDRDTERMVKFWKRVKPKLPSIDLETERETETAGGMGSDDALFEEAARLVVLHQQGSASLLQRRLKVGYSRAARLVDMLEEAGIVAPSEGSKAREVLVNDGQLDEILQLKG
jgi:S-DNA-T family DNA segregation ATPase FtsK/SpoIIIE